MGMGALQGSIYKWRSTSEQPPNSETNRRSLDLGRWILDYAFNTAEQFTGASTA